MTSNQSFPSLSQGKKYNKYQEKKTLDKQRQRPSKKEGFSLAKQTSNVINSNDYSTQTQQQTISDLRTAYQNVLQKYQTLESQISNNVSNYLERTNPQNNPYLNQTISFNNGALAYVTNQGVVKYIPNKNILQSVNVPTTFMNVNIPWMSSYETPGTIIPTNPTLVSGTPLEKGQVVGNEGNNVFVNSLLPSSVPPPSYMGCYASNSSLTYLGNSPSSDASGSYTFQECQQGAVSNGYQYFGLQNVNAMTGQGYCVVSNSNSDVVSGGISNMVKSKITLWSSNTSNQTGSTAILTTTGILQVINASGKAVYSSPSNKANPSNYFGCYSDASAGNAMTIYNNGAQQYSNSQCQQIAQENDYTYYGLQNSTSGTTAQCALSNDFSQSTQYGSATNCTKISDGSWSGGGLSNAIYSTTGGQSNYYLLLQNNGNMCIYRGTGPTDQQGYIWGTGTTGKQQDNNPSMVASLGKYGQNYMGSGFTLAPGDFIGSENGDIALVMHNNGDLVLYAYVMESSCAPIPNTNNNTNNNTNSWMGGGVNSNAMYNMGIQAQLKNLGMLGYVDSDSNMYTYPSSNQEYNNQYTTIPNATSSGNDIQGASLSNTTLETCQSACNGNSSCGGVVFDSDGNNCYPKTSDIYPFGSSMEPSSSATIYVRGMQPSSSVSQTTNGMDSITFNNYINKGTLNNPNQFQHGLSNATTAQKNQLSQLQDMLNLLSSQIASLTSQFQSGATKTQTQLETNSSGIKTYLTDISKNTSKMKEHVNNNVQNIVNDSDIMVLQENYKYLFWSILAAGTVLVAMNLNRT